MFGISTWKWFGAAVGLTLIALLRIPVISTVANLLSIIPSLVMVLLILKFIGLFLFGGIGSGSARSGQDPSCDAASPSRVRTDWTQPGFHNY